MPKPRGTLVVAAAVLLACAPSAQVRAQATVERAELPNDVDNFLGDRIRFAVKTKAKLRSDPKQEVCVPALTRMSVIGKIETTKQLVVKIGGGLFGRPSKPVESCDVPSRPIPGDEAYLISADTLLDSGLARTGATYGALVVPFKAHLQGNKDVSASSTIGAYLGYRFETADAIGYTLTPIAFLGASNISVPTADANGQVKDQNLFGMAGGVGLIGTFKRSFQAGVVLGWDHVSKSSGYQYNGKPWIALEIGFSFLQ